MRGRIRLKPETFTTAGSELAYAYWALSAHVNIGDVSVFSPLPGIVHIYVMLKGGGIPQQDSPEIEAVKEVFGVDYGEIAPPLPSPPQPNTVSGQKLRAFTDFMVIYPINPVEVDYQVKWFITDGQASFWTQTDTAIKAAVAEYETWQTARAGRDVVPDRLIELCRAAGAKRIELSGLDFTKLDKSQVVRFAPETEQKPRIVFGGIESE